MTDWTHAQPPSGPWPAPATGPGPAAPPPGYGMPPGYGHPIPPMRLQHAPGKGLVIGLCGIGALLLSFFALPWISGNGEDATFKDLRDLFNPDDDATVDPNTMVTGPDNGALPGVDPEVAPSTTLIDPGTVTLPQPVPGQDTTFNTVTPPTSVSPIPQTVYVPAPSNNRLDDLEQYTDWSWLLVLYLAITGVLFSTWIVPTNRGARVLTGFLTSACLGLVNLADKDGTSAPRILATLSALYALLIQLQALWYLFWDLEHSPDPAFGALLGLAGAIAVVVACIIGTNRRWLPQPA